MRRLFAVSQITTHGDDEPTHGLDRGALAAFERLQGLVRESRGPINDVHDAILRDADLVNWLSVTQCQPSAFSAFIWLENSSRGTHRAGFAELPAG